MPLLNYAIYKWSDLKTFTISDLNPQRMRNAWEIIKYFITIIENQK